MLISAHSYKLRRAAARGLLCLLLVVMIGAALPLVAQDSAPPTLTPLPTDGPPPAGPASTVNGVELPGAAFQDRVRLTRFLYSYTIRETLRSLLARGAAGDDAFRAVQQFYNAEISRLQIPDLLADAVLDTMEEDALLAELATAQAVEVTDADIDAQLRAFVGQPEASDDATEEPALDFVAAMIAEATERTGVSEALIRDFFWSQALRNAWIDEINGPMPEEWPVLDVRHILVDTEADANDVLLRLEAGEDFAEVAADVSLDPGSAAQGGALGAAVAEAYVGPFADAIREAEVGVVVGPVLSEFGYHIIEVTDRSVQPLDNNGLAALARTRNTAFREWLNQQMTGASVQRSSDWPSMVPNQPNGIALLQEMLSEL